MVGWKQATEKADADLKRKEYRGLEQGQCHLSQKMLHLWSLGKLSATAMQALAKAAFDDGLEEPEIKDLAALGAWGQHPSNIHRDLLRQLEKKISKGELGGLKQSPKITVKVPVVDNKEEDGMAHTEMDLFLPHLFVSTFSHSYPSLMEACFAPSQCKAFWDQVHESDPRLHDSPVAWEKASKVWEKRKHKTVPLWLHGDGVEFSTDSLLLFSFGGCLNGLKQSQASGSGLKENQQAGGLKQSHVMDAAFYVAGWPKSATHQDTWTEIFSILSWSFKALWLGQHPSKDWKGQPVTGIMAQMAGKPLTKDKLRFYVWNYLGDLEYFANILKLPHWGKHAFCWWCDCHRQQKGKSPWDFRSAPGWQLKQPAKLKAEPPSNHKLLTDIPGGLVAYRPAIDLLHTVDLGVSQRIVGSILFTWCFHSGATKTEASKNLRSLWDTIQAKYKTMKVSERFTNLTLSQFINVDKVNTAVPLLKGKAAEVRHLVPVLASVAWNKAQEVEDGGLKESHMAECLHNLSCFYDIVASADFFMTAEQSAEALGFIQKCFQHYAWLQQDANNPCLFQFTPKFHWAYHLGQLCRYQNPKTFWTYRQESWVGSMANLAHSCSHGTKATKLSTSLCQKYLLGFQLRINKYVEA